MLCEFSRLWTLSVASLTSYFSPLFIRRIGCLSHPSERSNPHRVCSCGGHIIWTCGCGVLPSYDTCGVVTGSKRYVGCGIGIVPRRAKVSAVGNASVGARLNGWLTAVWRFVSSAPLTYVWLVVLLITTIIQYHLTRRELHTVLVHGFTNIRHLATDPLRYCFPVCSGSKGHEQQTNLQHWRWKSARVRHVLGGQPAACRA
jgi:hypothetical protein